jgi:hypothetical protein
MRESGSIPLDQFVDIYVRFRHTHHFNALVWPVALWVSFIWPIPLTIYAWIVRRREWNDRVLSSTARIFGILITLNCVSLAFAGIWFVSESLVQVMFWRFSIYIKLLSGIGAAYVILKLPIRGLILWIIPLALAACVFASVQIENRDHPRWMNLALSALHNHRAAFILFTALAFVPPLMGSIRYQPRTPAPYVAGLLACIIFVVIGWNHWLGWGMTPEEVDPDYLQVCHWAREATPVDAVFLVPPTDTVFRLEAHRAIVVNFKHVPQLSGEMKVWLGRLEDVLGTTDIDAFPRDYMKLLPALDAKYESRTPAELIDVAHHYNARYIVVERDWGDAYRAQLIYRSDGRRYFVYDLTR